MNKKLLTTLLFPALVRSTYTLDTGNSLFPKRGNENHRPMGTPKIQFCCKCYSSRCTLYKFEYDKRICKKCRDELNEEVLITDTKKTYEDKIVLQEGNLIPEEEKEN